MDAVDNPTAEALSPDLPLGPAGDGASAELNTSPNEQSPEAPNHGGNQEKALAQTAGNAAFVAVGMVISGLFGYVQTIAATHVVSRTDYGVFSVVFTMTIFVGNLTKLGLDGTLVRFLPRYRAHGERDLVAGLVRIGLFGPLGISVICAVLLFAGAPIVADSIFHSDVYTAPIREGAILIPLASAQGMLMNALLALKSIKWQVTVGKVIEPIATPALLLVFFLLGLRIEALIYAYVVGYFISVVVGWIVFHRAIGKVTGSATPRYESRVWMHFGAALLFGSMTNSVVQSTDVLGVGAFGSAAEVGLYRVSDRVSSLISLPIFALSSIFAPTIAELHARGNHQQLANMFAVISRWMLTLSLPVFLCCVVFTKPILDVFGSGYAAGALAVLVLAIGNLVNAGTGPVGNMVAMTSRVRVLWFNTALRLVTNVVLIFLLVPRYTVVGAAVASSATIVVTNSVSIIEVWWMLKVHPYRWSMLKPLASGAIASLVGVVLVRVTHFAAHPDSSVHAFIYALLLVAAFVVVYAIALLLLGINQEDRQIIALARTRLTGASTRATVATR